MDRDLFDRKSYDYILVDSMNLAARSHFGIKVQSRGTPTGMMYGISRFIAHCKRLYSQSKVIFLWEGYGNVKKERFTFYKANRSSKDQNFLRCLNYTKRLICSFGYTQMCHVGLEADDVAAYLTIDKYSDSDILLVTNDEDWYQYMRPGRVDIMVKNMVYTYEDSQKSLGFPPDRMGIYKILTGDQSDNIPGVDRFPTKLAKKIACECDDYTKILDLDIMSEDPKWFNAISDNWELIRQNAALILYDPSAIDETKVVETEGVVNTTSVYDVFEFFEMNKSIADFSEIGFL